jgi:hypothetical protein
VRPAEVLSSSAGERVGRGRVEVCGWFVEQLYRTVGDQGAGDASWGPIPRGELVGVVVARLLRRDDQGRDDQDGAGSSW